MADSMGRHSNYIDFLQHESASSRLDDSLAYLSNAPNEFDDLFPSTRELPSLLSQDPILSAGTEHTTSYTTTIDPALLTQPDDSSWANPAAIDRQPSGTTESPSVSSSTSMRRGVSTHVPSEVAVIYGKRKRKAPEIVSGNSAEPDPSGQSQRDPNNSSTGITVCRMSTSP